MEIPRRASEQWWGLSPDHAFTHEASLIDADERVWKMRGTFARDARGRCLYRVVFDVPRPKGRLRIDSLHPVHLGPLGASAQSFARKLLKRLWMSAGKPGSCDADHRTVARQELTAFADALGLEVDR